MPVHRHPGDHLHDGAGEDRRLVRAAAPGGEAFHRVQIAASDVVFIEAGEFGNVAQAGIDQLEAAPLGQLADFVDGEDQGAAILGEYGDFTGNGKEARYFYWDTWVAKYFMTGEKKAQTASALSDYSENYIEGWATDRQTGERRYIGMILNIIAYTGTLSIIVVSAPDAAQLRQQFPKADLKYPNDLLPMYNYNKFAVGRNDLTGTWSSNGGGTVSWYSTTTGEYAGATGAAMSDRFIFNANGTYSSEHKGGYGVVGSMNVYQQKYNGAYTVSNWQVTATKRWEGKTEQFSAWFEIVRGGRVLHLDGGGGKSYTLYKER